MRGFIILVFLVFLTACSATEKGIDREVWKVITVSSENFPVRTGMDMTLSEHYVRFTNKKQTVGYSILKNDDRLVIDTDTARLLFRIERTSDSTLFFHELYSNQPLTLSFTKITNHKKHKK